MHTQLAKAQTFRDLHTRSGIFLMPNAWDPGSARMLASSGFPAIGTTSAGISFSHGVADSDGAVSQSEMIDCVERIVQSVGLPVSADLEAGYGTEPDDVAKTIEFAIAAGAVGGNIEDFTGNPAAPLFDSSLAAQRIRAARAAADATGIPFTLTARTDCYLANTPTPFSEAVHRANLYREAGADCLFIPGVSDPDTLTELVKEIDGPLTVVMGLSGSALTVSQLQEIGVRRVTIGGSLARATYGLIRKAAQEMAQHGTFDYSTQQIPHAELCAFFSGYADS